MKKLIAIMLTLAIIVSCSGCGAGIISKIMQGEDPDQAIEEYLIEHEDEINEKLDDINEKAEERGQAIIDAFENAETEEDYWEAYDDAVDLQLELEDMLWGSSSSYEIGSDNILYLYDFPGAYDVELYEYPIGSIYENGHNKVIDGVSYYLGANECFGFACYMQCKLYGANQKQNPECFVDILDGNVIPDGQLTAEKAKELITEAGVGAHIRTAGSQHSMIVIDITEDGFTILDANGVGTYNKIDVRTVTWQKYIDGNMKNGRPSGYGSRGITYIMVYAGE